VVSGGCEPSTCFASGLGDAELVTILGIHATPNPFTGSVALRIAGPRATAARILIFNAAGRLVRTPWKGTLTGRAFTVSWDGRDESGREVPAGVYLIRAQGTSGSAVRRLVLIR
jgi:flagellar hook assembly protein FlgD